jgi:hypothetical protein
MKVLLSNPTPARPIRRDERGFMIITLLVMVSIMLIYVALGLRSLNTLHQDLKGVEKKQIQRLQK